MPSRPGSTVLPSEGSPGGPQARLPLVGRRGELRALLDLLDLPPGEVEPVVFLTAESGVGKTRLSQSVASRAAEKGWTVAAGRSFPVEAGVPYAPFADAFLPVLRSLGPETLTVLSRGGERELAYLFPALGVESDLPPGSRGDPDEFRTRILWNFAELLRSLAGRTPLLVVLEDLHWSDASSLQLLHFLARQRGSSPILYLCTYSDDERDHNDFLVRTERSLQGLRLCRRHALGPLSHGETLELVSLTFGVEEHVVREFGALLYGWTRGNPFFIEETLKGLVQAGKLRERDGTWLGWEVKEPALPRSIRDAVLGRLRRVSPHAAGVADMVAVVGARATYALLARVTGLKEDELLEALDELCAQGVLEETSDGTEVLYDFVQPLVRETLYRELGLARARSLHGTIAESMETDYGDRVMEHADELAAHFVRADASQLAAKTARYLAAAGRAALARRADREAVDYLAAALERSEGSEEPTRDLLVDLARAQQHLGQYGDAIRSWDGARDRWDPEDRAGRASIERYGALARLWSGRPEEALECLGKAETLAMEAQDPALLGRIRLSRGICLQETGRADEAREQIQSALDAAREMGDPELLARAHRSMALVRVWLGPPSEVRKHGERALELAAETGDPQVAFWSHWGMAVLGGLTGDGPSLSHHLEEARSLAEELRSPVLSLWTAEVSIEQAFALGDWESGIAMGERAITLARSLHQQMLLPRLLVWTSAIYLGRGDLQRGRELVDEACELAGLGKGPGSPYVHAVVPAHIGLAHYHLTVGEYEEAVRVGEKGRVIAEGTGYVLWSLHRLLPVLAESYLWLEDTAGARQIARLMREHATPLDHRLGLAWADACEALIQWKEGDPEGGAIRMREAAEALEAIPIIPAAARIRRQLAGRLAETGDREGALQELRLVHDTFSRLGAQEELEKARTQFREVGTRPPPRTGGGDSPLTEREAEIAVLVARGRSNKAVARELAISPRTVSTHLSNIFQKLEIGSRVELAEMLRDGRLGGA